MRVTLTVCKSKSRSTSVVNNWKVFLLFLGGPRWHSGKGAVLQIGRSLVQSQMVSLEFFIDIILPIAGIFPGGKSGRWRKADNLTAILCRCQEIWEP
jgi:hypothetical protein